MSWDELLENLFAGFYKRKGKLNKKKKLALLSSPSTVLLENVKGRLIVLARAITGEPIEIYTAKDEGGYKNNNFFLPAYSAFFDSYKQNYDFYIFRTIYLSYQKKLKLNWTEEVSDISLEKSRQKAIKTAPLILKEMFSEFYTMKETHQKMLSFFKLNLDEDDPVGLAFLYGKWMQNSNNFEGKSLKEINEKVKKAIQEEVKTTLKVNGIEEMKTQEHDKKQQEDQVVHNYYEKIETLEEHQGGIWKDFDGEDELEAHKNALDELTMTHIIRTDEETHSVYETEFLENVNISESQEVLGEGYFFTYDEWNYKENKYKPEFCKLYTKIIKTQNVSFYHKTLSENKSTLVGLRKMLANIHNRYIEQKRQSEGENFDLDAVTGYLTDILSNHTPEDKIYLSKRKMEKDISILILLDISLSSDGYVTGNRVIDIEKQVSILFGEILNEYQVDFSIQAFFSKTRNYSTYLTIKDFDELWNQGKYRLGEIEPQGYTRIGTALRHSGYLLEKRQAKNKWVLLISDGKPNDYDRYEGKYGIRDVRQALRELKLRNIQSYALAIEAEAKYYLPQMFGVNYYKIMSNPNELLKAMVLLFEKIKR